MRRSLASLLILFFGLGPLTATLQASDESRLPACCRRHGAHHCAMSDAMRSQMAGPASGSTPAFSAPSYCPLYPHDGSATTVPPCAMAALLLLPHMPQAQRLMLDYSHGTARDMGRRSPTGRSPPLSEPL